MRLFLSLLLGLALRANAAVVYNSDIVFWGLTTTSIVNLNGETQYDATTVGPPGSVGQICPDAGTAVYTTFTGLAYVKMSAAFAAAVTGTTQYTLAFTLRRNIKTNNAFVMVDNNGGGLAFGWQMGNGATGSFTVKKSGSDILTYDFGDDAGVDRTIIVRGSAAGVTLYAGVSGCGTPTYVSATANNASLSGLAVTELDVGSFPVISTVFTGPIYNLMFSRSMTEVYPPVLPTPTPTPATAGQLSPYLNPCQSRGVSVSPVWHRCF